MAERPFLKRDICWETVISVSLFLDTYGIITVRIFIGGWALHLKKLCLFFIVLTIVFTGCAKQENSQISATTLPVYEFTVELCKNTSITVSRLITENVSCLHEYSVHVSQMQKIESAQAVVLSGAGLEAFLEDVLSSKQKTIDASEGISLICGHEDHHVGHNHEHDPHIWLSPENAKQMCKNIAAHLSDMYPAYAAQFDENLTNLLAKLDALQQYGETALQNLSCRNLITFHDGFSYFAESFDLHILKAVEEESGSEVAAKELIVLSNLIQEHQIPGIFTEINGSTASANVISAEIGVKIYTLDMAMSGSSYFDAMYHNINTIKEALG